MQQPISADWMTPKQVEAEYGINESTLRYWHRENKVTRELIGKQSFYKRDEIERLAAERRERGEA
jgi:DNA-binding transcriptional MerR regulator